MRIGLCDGGVGGIAGAVVVDWHAGASKMDSVVVDREAASGASQIGNVHLAWAEQLEHDRCGAVDGSVREGLPASIHGDILDCAFDGLSLLNGRLV